MTTRRTVLHQILGLVLAPLLPRAIIKASVPQAEATAPMTMEEFWAGGGHFRFSGRALIELGEKIQADREARRLALGMPRGFEIPERPIPASRAEREAELAEVTQLMHDALKASLALPLGPQRESQAVAMVAYRERRFRLMFALRDDPA